MNVLPAPVTGPDAEPELDDELLELEPELPHAATPIARAAAHPITANERFFVTSLLLVVDSRSGGAHREERPPLGRLPATVRKLVISLCPGCEHVVNPQLTCDRVFTGR